ncbi:SpaH/EbpB family LPXTG-anchored major pilin [Xylanimonas ulmi]|nr:SpaH/EbpB family LPXTG-anchored major pilin [Xylanibacterium ulmi]
MTIRRGLRSAALATLMGALALTLGAGTARAADPSPVIDPKAKGSITIHKYATTTTPTTPGDGAVQEEPDGVEPMDGVTFTVAQVLGVDGAYDLTTNAGWRALSGLTPEVAQAEPFGVVRQVTTGTDGPQGVAVAANLPVGVYLVTETVYPAGATAASPFLITVPMTDPGEGTAWLYDVHAYPKNSIVGATKTVDDDPSALFHDVMWTIVADIPDVPVIDTYLIVDMLDARLDYQDATVSLTGQAPLAPEDYTVEFHPATSTVVVAFTAQGLATLADRSAEQVKVVIATKANATGQIPNTAIVYPNAASLQAAPGEPGGPVTTPEVETKWGSITLVKRAETEQGAVLPGAQFAVYLTQADARAGVNAIATGTTGADGSLTFTGLRYSDFSDGVPVAVGDPGYQSYWIAETAAPVGYTPLAEPFEVAVVSEGETVRTIVNLPVTTGFGLPLTGGAGTGMLLLAGALIIVGMALLVTRRRRPSGEV